MTFSKKFLSKSPFKQFPDSFNYHGPINSWEFDSPSSFMGPTPPQPVSNMTEAERNAWFRYKKRWEREKRLHDATKGFMEEKPKGLDLRDKKESEDENGEEKVPWWKKLFKKKD